MIHERFPAHQALGVLFLKEKHLTLKKILPQINCPKWYDAVFEKKFVCVTT